jgi:hypothetical protein
MSSACDGDAIADATTHIAMSTATAAARKMETVLSPAFAKLAR